MIRVSKLADYGTSIAALMAKMPEHVFSASDIAEKLHLSAATVSKILKLLTRASLVVSTRGAKGGYQLVRDPEKIYLTDVIEAVEGNIGMTACMHDAIECELETVCTLKGNWQIINRVIYNELNRISLAQMIRPMQLEQPITFVKREEAV